MTPLAVSQRRAKRTSLSRKLSLPVMSQAPVRMGIGPLAPPEETIVAPATKVSFFFGSAAPAATALGGSRYHHAMGVWRSSPTVISTVPSVPMMISPISGRDPLKNGENWLVLIEE